MSNRERADEAKADGWAGIVLDAFGLACYIAYSYLFWDSPLLLDRVSLASGAPVAHELLLVQGLATGVSALAFMFAWGKVAPLRHNGALLASLALLESLAVALACGGWEDASVACSLAGFGISGFGSVMRLGWEERFSVRGVPAVAVRAAIAYLLGTLVYVLVIALLPVGAALVATGTLPMVSLVILLWRAQTSRGRGVVMPDPAIAQLGAQESLRECFSRIPWRIPVFVALSYGCFGATRMNMLADSLMSDSVLGALTPAVAMLACAAGIGLAYVSYRSSVQAGICIAVPIMAAAGLVNLLGGAQTSVAILAVTNVGVEITKYIMLFLMVDVIVKDGAPALMCLALLRFAQWMGSALGQAVADALPSGFAVLVVLMAGLMAALIVTIGTLPRSASRSFAEPEGWVVETAPGSIAGSASGTKSTGGAGADDVRGSTAGPREASTADAHASTELGRRASSSSATGSNRASAGETADELARRYGLSPREREVLGIWVTGKPAEYVEKTLFISKSTVKTHLTHIYAKTGTANRVELVELFESIRDE